MIGISAWADYGIYRGLGVEAEGTDIMAGEPKSNLDRYRSAGFKRFKSKSDQGRSDLQVSSSV